MASNDQGSLPERRLTPDGLLGFAGVVLTVIATIVAAYISLGPKAAPPDSARPPVAASTVSSQAQEPKSAPSISAAISNHVPSALIAFATPSEKPESAPEVIFAAKQNPRAQDCIALLARVAEGERTASYDGAVEKMLPEGKILDTGLFNDRAATASFFKTLANESLSYFKASGFKYYAGTVLLLDEKSSNSGLAGEFFFSVQVTLQVRVIDVATGRSILLSPLHAVGAGFTAEAALLDARSKVTFPQAELQRALKS